ncbi:MAG: hypothetical protein CSA34_06405 [Desulfobulbus propionicus]|nr:MAG: hypothetical protein CSA34_06405 [Desulfobulbus propionicus]
MVQIKVDDERGYIFTATLALEPLPLDLPTVRHQLLKKPVMPAFIIAGSTGRHLSSTPGACPISLTSRRRDEKNSLYSPEDSDRPWNGDGLDKKTVFAHAVIY